MTLNFRQNNGFTLIELIVVISLISLMFFFAIPRIQVDILSDNTRKVSRWIMLNVSALKEKAVHDQKRYALHLSLDSNRLWVTNDTLSEEELEEAAATGYNLPEDIKLLDVEYPDKEKISAGRADIYFYKKGYSDKAMIHITNNDNEVRSFLIEPFLSRVRLYNKYIEFED
ncbi:MAG: prepilin-type N-terminal cleavage/methylation domain-containing protein [Deltaproteobacteria bacterium]|nr:prepilin-type N-terminal cleavage/methylation domain-containing protein [Deltaproteobacteria bacterium]